MLVPMSWLKEYTDIDVDTEVFMERMIMSGSNIETAETFGQNLRNVVIGRILEVRPHEDSDHLLICRVDVGNAVVGGAPIQIVTGAPNVQEGILVIVALHGSILPGGVKIKKGKLRGVESNGMLCSATELGFSDKVAPLRHRDGIWVLPEEFEPGQDAVAAMGLDETVVDFEITPNRPDCLSILGMAREAAAVFGGGLRYPDTGSGASLAAGTGADMRLNADPGTDMGAGVEARIGLAESTGSVGSGIKEASGQVAGKIRIEIKKPELCGRYVARLAEDVVIEESPWWLQRRLMFAGMRPINNIVDITNYVMLETGHPIHAFDIRMIAKNAIVVDTAPEGSLFTTLDGTERVLSGDMLLINDGEKGVAIAGVMGGLNSEIEEDTTTILIEAANFNPDSVRLTAKGLGLRSEASSRFEKGVSAELSGFAADRVCTLIAATGAGRPLPGAADNYPGKKAQTAVDVRPDRMNALLGTHLSGAEMKAILERLEMQVECLGEILRVTPPHVRVDLKEEVDFSEEIGRIFGYDALDTTMHADGARAGMSDSWFLRGLLREVLTAQGYYEIQTYSFVSPKGVDHLRLPQDAPERQFVRLINPLGEENSVMRTLLLPNLLEILAGNYNRGNAEAALFEAGNTFRLDAGGDLPEERLSLALGAYGEGQDFFALKGAVESLLSRFGICGAIFEAASDAPAYHPGRCARIVSASNAALIGYMGEIHQDVRAVYGLDAPACCAELDLDALVAAADLTRAYSPLDRYPASLRDISLLADESVTVGALCALIQSNGGGILESVSLFDVYRGKQIPEGKKSLSFSLTYRASDRTLTDEEVEKVHNGILETLRTETGASLREM